MNSAQPLPARSRSTDRHGRWHEVSFSLSSFLALGTALLATSCCILPLLFVFIGVSGAWIGNLTALAPYQSLILAAAVIALALGFRSSRRRAAAAADCSEGYCARPQAARWRRGALWLGVVLVGLSLAFNLVVPLLIT